VVAFYRPGFGLSRRSRDGRGPVAFVGDAEHFNRLLDESLSSLS